MAMFYDKRIRLTVLDRWSKDQLQYMESTVTSSIPESEIQPEESAIMKDFKIPISYKNMIAQELWGQEEEAIKNEVRSRRDADFSVKTVYNTQGEDRMELIRDYAK
jgi:hypothetical protein